MDQATGELDKLKSRHAADGARLKRFREKLGLPPTVKGTCNIVDDFTLKLFISQNHLRRRKLAKADIFVLSRSLEHHAAQRPARSPNCSSLLQRQWHCVHRGYAMPSCEQLHCEQAAARKPAHVGARWASLLSVW